MIYDCFLYNGEADLLKIRLDEFSRLSPLKITMPVTHIIIEGAYTFTGIRKSEDEMNNIPDVVLDPSNHAWMFTYDKVSADPWKNEEGQRNMIKDILERFHPEDNDIIIISDVDEIPRAYAVQHYRPEFGLCSLQMNQYYYYLNCLADRNGWILPKIMTWSYLKDKTPDEVRRSGFNLCMWQAGWHYSYMGGVSEMIRKFKSFSHQEPEIQALADERILQNKLSKLESLWATNKLNLVGIDDAPFFVQQKRDQFKHMIYAGEVPK